MNPNEVPDALVRDAVNAMVPVPHSAHEMARHALAAAWPEIERQVREQVAREVADPFLWPDPFGNWTAEQADAARAMKEHILPRIVRGETR